MLVVSISHLCPPGSSNLHSVTLIWEQTLENQVNGGFCSWYLCKWAFIIHSGSADGSPHITTDVSRAIWSPAFNAGSLCHQLQLVWPCRVNFLSMKCGFGLHLWLLWKSDRGFLPLTLKKMVKRPTVFWALVFVGFLCTFLPGYFILSFSQTLLCLSQRLCVYVPSHPLEQVGASTAGPKTARSWCVTVLLPTGEPCQPMCHRSATAQLPEVIPNSKWIFCKMTIEV